MDILLHKRTEVDGHKGVTGVPRGVRGGLGKMGNTKGPEIWALKAVSPAKT